MLKERRKCEQVLGVKSGRRMVLKRKGSQPTPSLYMVYKTVFVIGELAGDFV